MSKVSMSNISLNRIISHNAIFVFLFAFLTLQACNGHSGDTTSSSSTDTDIAETSLTVVTLNASSVQQTSFTDSEVITVQAKLIDQDGAAIVGSRIDFSADLGELSTASTLTNSNGVAEVQLSNTDKTLSAGTVTASSDTLSETVDFEFIDSGTTVAAKQLSIQLLLNGVATNQFTTNETAQVQVTLVDENNDPIANEQIDYTTSLGSFSSTNQSVLTSSTGETRLTLLPSTETGAGIVSASLASDSDISATLNFQVISADTVTEDIRIGYIDSVNGFIESKVNLLVTGNSISAGGTTAVSVDLVDSNGDKYTTPVQVSFSSNCITNDKATIDLTVLSINGTASTTFEDINCGGTSGTDDLISASITLSNSTVTASETLEIKPESLGSIEFVSADPEKIFLKGSGQQENSTLTFLVKGTTNNPIAQQEVEFSLNNEAEGLGITLSRISGFTNSQGIVSTQVTAGLTPAIIRVTAKTVGTESVQTQSTALTANTGQAHQSGFTIAASILNPEASYIGTQSIISAWLSDSFSNPVPDNTVINFTAEGGTIESSCQTTNGFCSVTWTATEPYPTDHRATILATSTGHETFFDTNGNNTFDSEDGVAIDSTVIAESDLKAMYAGFGNVPPQASGFIDMPEAWRDDNEDGDRDPVETKYFDQDGSGDYSAADDKFNGRQCDEASALCAAVSTSILRKAMVISMSSAAVDFILTEASDTTSTCQSYTVADVYHDGNFNSVNATSYNALPASIADGGDESFIFQISDSQGQPLPINSSVTVTSSAGVLSGTTSFTQGNTSATGCTSMFFTVENETGGDPETANITVEVTTPQSGTKTYISRFIQLL